MQRAAADGPTSDNGAFGGFLRNRSKIQRLDPLHEEYAFDGDAVEAQLARITAKLVLL